MTKYKFDFSLISFDEAQKNITIEDIEQLIVRSSEKKESIKIKKILFLILGLAIPLVTIFSYGIGHDSMPETTFSRSIAIVTAVVFISILLYSYYKSKQQFLFVAYKSFTYTALKILYLSYLSGTIGRDAGNYWQTLVTITTALIVFLFLYYFVEKNMTYAFLNENFQLSLKTIKILNMLIRFSGILIVVGLLVVQFYRMNKWWLEGNIPDSTGNSFMDLALIIILGVPFFLVLTLIPTYIAFKPEIFVKGQLLEQYSEKFRKLYEFSKEEWYGEK